MFRADSPARLLAYRISALLQLLALVREGTEEAIHQTRVAIRRVRELVALGRGDFKEDVCSTIEERLRRASKSLGRVRDADIGQQLIHRVELRFPAAPTTLTRLRTAVTAEQLRYRRKALKKIESLDLESLPRQFSEAARRDSRWHGGVRAWKDQLRQHIALRAETLQAAMERAGGVYFPNRVHAVRVATKQLRYTLELADATALWHVPEAVRVLEKTQDALGQAHDRELLIERLDELAADGSEDMRREIDALLQFLHAEIASYHAKYLRWRTRIIAVCEQSVTAGQRSVLPGRALAIAGLSVPSYFLLRSITSK
jgi:CHAD domain-containing protein